MSSRFRALTFVLLSIGVAAFGITVDAQETKNVQAQSETAPAATEHFGWSNTNIAGKAAGEIGVVVSTSVMPVYYADEIPSKSLKDELKASGSICLPAQPATKSAVFIGWFNSNFKGWRSPTCIGFWVSGDDEPNDLVFTYSLTDSWDGARGAQVTHLRIPRDGKRHAWSFKVDPQADKGKGAIIFAIEGQKPFVTNLPPGFKVEEAVFDSFGIIEAQASSDPFTIYLDDLQYDGKTQDFSADPGWRKGGGGTRAVPYFLDTSRARNANSTWPSKPITQDALAERIKAEPNGALSFYTRNKDNKLTKSFMITPEGSLVAGGTITNGPDVPLTSEASMLPPSEYDNAPNGVRLGWVNDFFFSLGKSAGLGSMQSEGQPMLLLRVLALMGRGDSPDIQLGRAGPNDGRTNYGPLEATEAGSCLGKIIFKAYTKDKEKTEGDWTGDIAGIYARNEIICTREKSQASLHFTTAGASVKNSAWRENIERMVIRSNGHVAIGDDFNQPTERLHVQGNIRAEGDIVAAGAKKFVINHPTQPGKQLVHAAIEGPETATYYRGEDQLINGHVEINLPSYFEALTHSEGRTVILTNLGGFDRLAVENPVKDGKFVVISDNPQSAQKFYWEVKAIRSDISPLQVER